jgi:hypothetical protein
LTDLPQKIADTLGETNPVPLKQIRRIVEILGESRAQTLLDEALDIEAAGGMLTADGKRRRTPGGVFFKLAKDKATPEERRTIFPPPKRKKKAKPKPPEPGELARLANEALKGEGEVTTVKLTIIGRPGRIIEKESVMITSMQSSKPPTLPKGLPRPPGDPTVYVVYIALKQWRKVQVSIQNDPNDKLIVEGYPVFDKRIGQGGVMTVYAQSVTTVEMQHRQRERQ